MTVPIGLPLPGGSKVKIQFLVNHFKVSKIMHVSDRKFATVFGLCVTIVSLCSGCAVTNVSRMPMSERDLNFFHPNCRIKEQQIAMLQSMRQSEDEMLFAGLGNIGNFWTSITDPDGYQRRQEIASGAINKQINWNLQHLKHCS